MDRYTKVRTEVSSAYCPVCCVKTVELQKGQTLRPLVFEGSYYHLVPVAQLCCSEECAKVYIQMIQDVNSHCYGSYANFLSNVAGVLF